MGEPNEPAEDYSSNNKGQGGGRKKIALHACHFYCLFYLYFYYVVTEETFPYK